jgi:hypothetical protein
MYLSIHSAKRSVKNMDSHSECSDDEVPFDHTRLEKNKAKGKKRSRVGISEEVFGNYNKKDSV